MKSVMQDYVTFVSPGTFFPESTTQEIDSWDVNKAIEMSKDIIERYNATPYSFVFTTRGRGENDLDSKEIDRSCNYFLGGQIETIEDVRKRNDPKERILLSNMEINDIERVIVNDNSWRATLPIKENDIVLQMEG